MSRAFVKDDDGGQGIEDLPDRLISSHPNFVTVAGLAAIEAKVAALSRAYADAQASGERGPLQSLARDLRYWTARRASAELQPEPVPDGRVHFGSRVAIERHDGRRQTFMITGEDEADPASGSISYVSPLAQALIGKGAGDSVTVAGARIEVLDIQ